MNNDSHRVISIVLNEQEWQAFVRVHPQPVVWLRERIQETIAPAPTAADAISGFVPAAAAANTTSATTR
jgi:hypothetical protein